MQEQGYNMDVSLLYQDKVSAMLLEMNGKASSLKQTKHVKMKFFFVKDTRNCDELPESSRCAPVNLYF
jgi:hypothetical protein